MKKIPTGIILFVLVDALHPSQQFLVMLRCFLVLVG